MVYKVSLTNWKVLLYCISGERFNEDLESWSDLHTSFISDRQSAIVFSRRNRTLDYNLLSLLVVSR